MIEPPAPPEKMPFVSNSAKRLPNETHKQYRKRRTLVNKVEKWWLDGRVIWKSRDEFKTTTGQIAHEGRTFIK
jgi:hypothetical protein